MFTELVESRRRRTSFAGQSLLSLALHLGLGAGAVGVAGGSPTHPVPPPRQRDVIFELPASPAPTSGDVTAPPDQMPAPSPFPSIPTVPIPVVVPTDIPAVTVAVPADPRWFVAAAARSAGLHEPGTDGGTPRLGSSVLLAAEADEAPHVAPEARCSGTFPPQLRAMAVVGHAELQFIINRDGRVDSASVQVTRTTHPAFADAARAGVLSPGCRYVPGTYRGATVRVLVRQRASFRVEVP